MSSASEQLLCETLVSTISSSLQQFSVGRRHIWPPGILFHLKTSELHKDLTPARPRVNYNINTQDQNVFMNKNDPTCACCCIVFLYHHTRLILTSPRGDGEFQERQRTRGNMAGRKPLNIPSSENKYA